MINADTLAKELQLKQLTNIEDTARDVTNGYVCDLLSWVMARGEQGMAWVTVQTHLNVVAVACLHDFSCVIIPEDIEVPQPTLDKANEEGMPIFSSGQTAYEICREMGRLKIGEK